MADEFFDEKQYDLKVKNLIDSFLKQDTTQPPAPQAPQAKPENLNNEEIEDNELEQDKQETEHELTEEEKFELSWKLLSNKYDVVANDLLGDFDEQGNYKINDFIMAELLAMPKLLDRNVDGQMELTCEYKDGTLFSFTATKPQVLENGDALTNLVLNEKVEYPVGRPKQIISTIVGSYLYKFTDDYDIKRMLVFNIYKRDDPGINARTPTDYIGFKLAYNKAVADAGHDLFEKLEETYFNKKMQIINGLHGGALILSLFNEKRKLLEQQFANNPKGKYRALNQLLKQVLQSPIAAELVQSEEYVKAMKSLDEKYMATAKKISEIIVANEQVAKLKKEREQKQAEQLGVYITEIMGKLGDRGPLIAGAIVEGKKQQEKKAATAKKAQKADEKAKGGGGKKGGGKKSGGKKKSKSKSKGKDKKKVIAIGKVIVKSPKAVKKLSHAERARGVLKPTPQRHILAGQLGGGRAGENINRNAQNTGGPRVMGA